MQNKNIENEKSNSTMDKIKKLVFTPEVIGTIILLGLGGNVVTKNINNDHGFDNKRAQTTASEPDHYMKASHSVIPGAQVEAEPKPVLKGPYLEASHSVLVPPGTEQTSEK